MTEYRRTWLEALNWFVFRWFFFRLARVVDIESGRHIRWTILFPVWPSSYWVEAE